MYIRMGAITSAHQVVAATLVLCNALQTMGISCWNLMQSGNLSDARGKESAIIATIQRQSIQSP